ncbi:MAG TPA: PDZ domain-containing protein, partial [Thermoanaerobaculia bacterium]|nr:PDZ domain-containing protein [Thermoanaerobaculia bacterium]
MISPRRRVWLAVGLTVLVIGGTIGVTALRIQRWNHLGWAGLAYLQSDLPEEGVWGMKPGGIILTYPGGPAGRAGIRQGDTIRTIGGIGIKDVPALRQLDARVRSGDTVTYRVSRGGVESEHIVRFASPLASSSMALTGIVNGIVALAFVVIGLLVFTRSPGDRRAVVFYAMTVAGAMSLLVAVIMALDGSNARGIVTEPNMNLLVLAVAAAMTFAFIPLTLHLSLVFPKDRPVLVNRPYILGWVYGVPIAAVVLMLVSVATMIALSGARGPEAKMAGSVVRWTIAGFALASLALAFLVVRRARGERVATAFIRRPAVSIIVTLGILLGLVTVAVAMRWKMFAAVLSGFTTVLPFLAVALFPIFACIALYRSYREAGTEERRQVKWPLWGILIALGTKILFTIVMYAITTWVMATGA